MASSLQQTSSTTCYRTILNNLNLFEISLKPKQIEILDCIRSGCKEVIGVLPTGYGKSLVYQMLPFLLDGSVLVISPLTVIQQEQLRYLQQTQLKCCILNTRGRVINSVDCELEEELIDIESSVPLADIYTCQLIFAHPEAIFHTAEGKDLLDSQRFRTSIKAIVIDECHKVSEWGKQFRTAFKCLQDIAAFFPTSPRLALSATVTLEMEREIIKALGMKKPNIIKENPDRPNVFLSKQEKELGEDVYERYENIYKPLVEDLKQKKHLFPVTLVYIPLQYMGNAISYCKHAFKKCNLQNCMYGALCSGQDEIVKQTILTELGKKCPRIRLVFCTSVVGMGFNSPCVERVIHTKPPHSVTDFVQEFGRAGRAGQSALSVVHYCNHDIATNIQDMKQDIIGYCREEKCLREYLLKQFGFKKTNHYLDHDCCTYCKNQCSCFECAILGIEL